MNNKMANTALEEGGAKLLLRALSAVAKKNATSLCKGFIYEPEIPKKLRK